MNEFVVIYEFSPYRYFGLPVLVLEAIALLVLYHIFFQREPRPTLGAWIIPVLFVCFAGLVNWSQLAMHMRTVDAVRLGQVHIVEGEVTDVQSISRGGDQMYAVGGVVFSEISSKPGFDANEQWGYRLQNGLYARVHYFDIPSRDGKLGWLAYKTCGTRIVTKFELRRTPAPRTSGPRAPAQRYENCDL